MKLENKIAVITGGSSGIGLSTAELFLKEGAEVVISGSDTAKLQRAKKALGDRCLAIIADVKSLQEIDKLYQQVSQHFGRGVDILIVNAGIVKTSSIEQTTAADFDDIFSVNVRGAYFTAQKCLPYFNAGGSIIFISSLAGKSGMENFSVYCASKAALESLAKTFAAELAPRKIRVNSISPGVVKTPIFDSIGVKGEDLSEWAKMIPLKRVAQPEEIARAALYLASDDASYVTAADLSVDGGLTGISLF